MKQRASAGPANRRHEDITSAKEAIKKLEIELDNFVDWLEKLLHFFKERGDISQLAVCVNQCEDTVLLKEGTMLVHLFLKIVFSHFIDFGLGEPFKPER